MLADRYKLSTWQLQMGYTEVLLLDANLGEDVRAAIEVPGLICATSTKITRRTDAFGCSFVRWYYWHITRYPRCHVCILTMHLRKRLTPDFQGAAACISLCLHSVMVIL